LIVRPVLTAEECGAVLRVVSEPARLRLLAALRDGPRAVGELELALGLRQYQASRHLAALLAIGLVEREPQGRRVLYRLAADLRLDDACALELGCCRLTVR